MVRRGDVSERPWTVLAVLLALAVVVSVLPTWSAEGSRAQRAHERRYELAYSIPGPGLYTTFGYDIVVRGKRLLVGAPALEGGDSYVAVFDLASGAPIRVHRGGPGSVFGRAIAASPRSIALGAPGRDEDRGNVFLLDRRARSLRSIPAPDGYDFFGRVLAWVGRRLYVGAWRATEGPSSPGEYGVVLLVDEETGAVVRTISSPRPEIKTWFGSSLAAVRGGLAIASPGFGVGDSAPGRVYVYDRAGNLVRTLARPRSAEGDHFGAALAGYRNRLLVGSPSHWLAGDGAAYLYAWREGTWTLERTFVSPDGSHFFGSAVALDGQHALIAGDEKVHLFDLETGGLIATLTPPPSPDPEERPPYPAGAFGQTVALARRTLLVAAPRQDENEEGYVFAYVPAK